ncbi:MAG: peptidoglycan-binding protein [Bacillaceae bacterium]|nr:peptidoglycan-binding protein [Bacillaceae bacterium]
MRKKSQLLPSETDVEVIEDLEEIEEDEVVDRTLREGDRLPEVITLKINLERLGFGISNNPTEWFGPITARTVREFQEFYGLNVTGEANDETLDKIDEILASKLQEDVRHKDVIKLKKDLARLGFSVSNNPTDWYGPVTTRTVKEFQKFLWITREWNR